MELKCLLMWLMVGSIKGSATEPSEMPVLTAGFFECYMREHHCEMCSQRYVNRIGSGMSQVPYIMLSVLLYLGHIVRILAEECPSLQRTEFADVVEAYPLGTKLYYDCDQGYKRRSGHYLGIQCTSTHGIADWSYTNFECIPNKTSHTDKNILLSTVPTVLVDSPQKPERKTQSPEPEKRENIPAIDWKAFCGMPKAFPHASLRKNKAYNVGQVLHFKCQKGYDKRPPTSGTRTCKEENGNIIWTPLDIHCTNDSSYKGPSEIIESDPSVSQWCLVQSVSGTIHPSFSSSLIQLVTAIFFVLLIIPAIFL